MALEIELGAAHHEVVRDEDASNGPQQCAVGDQPGKDVVGQVAIKSPGEDDDADGAGDQTAGAKADASWPKPYV